MADTFDAIADSIKREILQILLERGGTGEISAADLAEQLGVTTPTASKHLGVLRELGFVSAREEGRSRYFHLELAPFAALQAWLEPFVSDVYGIDPVSIDPVSSDEPLLHDETVVFDAWAGTDVGTNLGRALADRSFQARTFTRRFTKKP